MTKLVQICASQNDLFGLDDDGHVYQYNFNTSTWRHLGLQRGTSTDAPATDPAVEPRDRSRD